ncbi:HK97 family phage prohead protease [Streptomyces sp. PvR006]|uniref:HK97 family phage prohead protease n=1 Tax=Streptomyces sp. PvR006 TaxID=2817860 RepID=UPI001AE9BBE0|nr:HK97 family phage prohead protease [Streptomyces sp. PvR006]MBP2583391.1 HK97 family phage prohead protease [Streptomyces sp. PvR006]
MGTLHTAARDLTRSAPFSFQRASGEAEDGDGRTLRGYAAVFGQATEIDSWEGAFTETIRKGAFRKTIRESTPVLQFDHGRHPLIGSLPIGSIVDLREDDDGLFVEARITDNWLMAPVRDAIAEETVNGMSFRFEVVREQWRDVNGKLLRDDEIGPLLWQPGERGPLQRELVELKCRELGPVVFPAYAGTSVSVRARDVADGLAADEGVTRSIRASLARDAAAPEIPDDPELRREVAAALLYPAARHQPPGPAPAAPVRPEVPTALPGAPLEREHPPTPTDAPPADGHPSPSPRTAELRAQIQEITGLMGERLASIDTPKEKS